MTYRDEGAATRARADALQDEVERLREENEALRTGSKQGKATAATPSPSVAAQPTSTFTPRTPSVGFGVWQMVGGFVLLAVPCALLIASGRQVPDFPWGPFAMLGIVGGGPLLATSLHRVVFPYAPIVWRGQSGEYEEVHRSPARRRVYLAIALAVYLGGLVALFLAPAPLH